MTEHYAELQQAHPGSGGWGVGRRGDAVGDVRGGVGGLEERGRGDQGAV